VALSGPVGPAPVAVIGVADFQKTAEKTVTEAIQEVGSGRNVQVSAQVREGNAAQVLIAAAAGADLLVVGSRGHGGFTEALLGSVSQHCVHHAPCPVVIVRDTNGRGTNGGGPG
jgi:nucleotide-binding universal stress UspA family protein